MSIHEITFKAITPRGAVDLSQRFAGREDLSKFYTKLTDAIHEEDQGAQFLKHYFDTDGILSKTSEIRFAHSGERQEVSTGNWHPVPKELALSQQLQVTEHPEKSRLQIRTSTGTLLGPKVPWEKVEETVNYIIGRATNPGFYRHSFGGSNYVWIRYSDIKSVGHARHDEVKA